MPLTTKGKEIKKEMRKNYGSKEKGDQVFYASQNKGTITGTHKTAEVNSPAWLTGFVKASNELGVIERADVLQLLKIAQRLHLQDTHEESFNRGVEAIIKTAGHFGDALKSLLRGAWGSKKGLIGAGAAGGLGLMAPQIGSQMGIRPMNRNRWTIEDLQNAAEEYKDVAGRARLPANLGQLGQSMGGGRMGYFSPYGGYYTSPY